MSTKSGEAHSYARPVRLARRPWPIVLLLLAAGCSVDRSGLASDAGPGDLDGRTSMDAGLRRDTGPGLDARRPDADRIDAGRPPDGGPRDAGPRDGGPSDAGPPDGGAPPCDSLYGSASRYVSCPAGTTDTACEFYFSVYPSMATCNDVCGSSRCMAGYDHVYGTDSCVRGSEQTCDTADYSHACICARRLP